MAVIQSGSWRARARAATRSTPPCFSGSSSHLDRVLSDFLTWDHRLLPEDIFPGSSPQPDRLPCCADIVFFIRLSDLAFFIFTPPPYLFAHRIKSIFFVSEIISYSGKFSSNLFINSFASSVCKKALYQSHIFS